MKTLIFVIVLLISCVLTQAQNFIDTTKAWTVSERIHGGDEYGYPSTHLFRFEGDTLIDGTYYTKMSRNINNTEWVTHSYWIEDETGNIYKKGHPNDTFMYNFSIEKGDTLSIIGHEIVVDSTAIKPFGSKDKKHIYARYIDVPEHVITWIEGVGSLYGPHISDAFFLVGGKYTLICFKENNEHVYLNPWYTDCNAQSGTSVPKIENNSLFEIYDIGNGELSFRNLSGYDGNLSLVTLGGKTLKRSSLSSDSGIIHFPHKGIFLYSIVFGDNKIQTGKIMIQ